MHTLPQTSIIDIIVITIIIMIAAVPVVAIVIITVLKKTLHQSLESTPRSILNFKNTKPF